METAYRGLKYLVNVPNGVESFALCFLLEGFLHNLPVVCTEVSLT